MLTSEQVQKHITDALNAQNHQDYTTATKFFLGLLSAITQGQIQKNTVWGVYEECSHPYYNVLSITIGNLTLRVARPFVAVEAFLIFHPLVDSFENKSTTPPVTNEFMDCSADFDQSGLTFPEGWLLEEDAKPELWMLEAEIDRCGTPKEMRAQKQENLKSKNYEGL